MTGLFGTPARRGLIFAMAAGAALSALCAFGASAETIDQIYEAAKAEKSLVLWVPARLPATRPPPMTISCVSASRR
jgi:hypothetical protein